jgi:hypothetical protein
VIGVTIEWAENPLQTVVRLDETGRKMLWLRLKLEDFEDRLVSASFELDAEHRATDREGTPRTIAERAATAVQTIDLAYVLGDEERRGKKIDAHIDARLESYVEELAGRHDGDCICVACSCVKCHAESLLDINTIEGLGKHAASKIGGAFSPRDGRTASLDEAIARLRDYRPVYTHNPRWPEEEWQKHVPRWIEEGQRAYEWLVNYRQAHFTAPAATVWVVERVAEVEGVTITSVASVHATAFDANVWMGMRGDRDDVHYQVEEHDVETAKGEGAHG